MANEGPDVAVTMSDIDAGCVIDARDGCCLEGGILDTIIIGC